MMVNGFISRSSEETLRFGRFLGRLSRPGDTLALYGSLGAGKTCLTQGIAAGLGISDETVNSPTYALIAEHTSGRMPLYHMDAYRIQSIEELGPIGFHDYVMRADGLLVIEWADNIELDLPSSRVDIHLSAQTGFDDERTVLLTSRDRRSAQLLSDALTAAGYPQVEAKAAR